MDYSITATSGKVTFLVLWHFWANSFVGVAANGVGVAEMLTTFCAVYNHIVALTFLKRIELYAYR